MTGVSTPGKRSETIPLKSGKSTDVSFAMFMSFIASNKILKTKTTVISKYGHPIAHFSHLFISHRGVGALLASGVTQHRHKSSKSEVVMVLLGQLLHGKRVERVHFLRQQLYNTDG